jgi:hypothetical protein
MIVAFDHADPQATVTPSSARHAEHLRWAGARVEAAGVGDHPHVLLACSSGQRRRMKPMKSVA